MGEGPIPVIIIGAGPVGLSLAIDLGWRGVPALLIEKDSPDARKGHPRMDNVGVSTMEACRRWGISHQVEHAGFPRDLPTSIVYAASILGHEMARDDYPTKAEATPLPFSPAKHELCPQNFFDPVLQSVAASYPTTRLRYGTRLIALSQDDPDLVTVETEDCASGLREVLTAQYLVACDGAGSTVAAALGQVQGQGQQSGAVLSCSTNIFVRAPELADRTADRRAYRYVLMGDEGVWATFVNINGRDVWRLQVLGGAAWPTWTDDEVHAMIRRGIGADIPYELLSWMPWSRREYVTDRFRVGRCFLVGDAAHQLSPTGGYGMNTGIAEAVDLSWKLAAVIEGWGGDALLDSYELERRPVAVRNVRQASENLRAMRSVTPHTAYLQPDNDGAIARAETGKAIQDAMRREWRSFGIHLGAQYRGSPIIVEQDESDEPERDVAAFEQSARAGGRAPHVYLGSGKSTLDLFGRGFVLLDFSDARSAALRDFAAAAQAIGLPLESHRITSSEAKALYERSYVLVRPDGYVAWRGDRLPGDATALLNRVRGADSLHTRNVARPALLSGAERT